MRKVLLPHGPISSKAVGDERFSHCVGEAALPSGGCQLPAERVNVLSRGDDRFDQDFRTLSSSFARRFLFCPGIPFRQKTP